MTYGKKAFWACSAASSALMTAFPVMAQDASVASAAETDAEIVVTGSRIGRRDLDAESPIVTLSSAAIEQSGKATLGEALNQLPQLSPGTSATSSTGLETQASGRTSLGQTNPSLRGLGSRRTLVLLDGKRLQPATWFGAVDLNTIPNALIAGSEVITGGASAVYGSDAMAGVINLKTIRNFQGVTLNTQAGITTYGDGRSFDVSATAGSNFADGKGNVVLSLNFYDRAAIVGPRDRPWQRQLTSANQFQTGTIPLVGVSQASIDAYFASQGITDLTKVPTPAGSVGYNRDGTLFVTQGGNSTGTGRGSQAGGSNLKVDQLPSTPELAIIQGKGSYLLASANARSQLSSPMNRKAAFGRLTYELGSSINMYLQGNYAHYKTGIAGAGGEPFYFGDNGFTPVPKTNPFFLASDLAKLTFTGAVVPNGTLWLTKTPTEITYDQYQIEGGLDGKLFGDWTWNVYGKTGKTTQRIVDRNKILSSRWQDLINSPTGGTDLCAGGLNIFPLLSLSQACLDYILVDVKSKSQISQTYFEGNIQGGLFDLPGGEVRLAVGADYRRDTLDYDPDPLLAPVNAAGASLVQGYGAFTSLPTSGRQKAVEGYAELLLPLIKDVPFFERLEFNLAGRLSKYPRVGTVATYKGSAEWEPTSGLLLRGGYQRAIRAPSVGELYAPGSAGVESYGNIQGGIDPCAINSPGRTGALAGVDPARLLAICLAQGSAVGYTGPATLTTTIGGGNVNLDPETSTSYTLGGTFRPKFSSPLLSGISLSIDYYNIKIKDAIGQVSVTQTFQSCFNYNGLNPTYDVNNPFCKAISLRVLGGIPIGVTTPLVNIAAYQTSGLDFQFDWRAPLDAMGVNSGGALSLNAVVTYLASYKRQAAAGEPLVDFAGTIGFTEIDGTAVHPRWRGIATLSYVSDASSFGVRARYTGSMGNYINVTSNANLPSVPSTTYFDLFGRVNINSIFELRGGVNNVFNQAPRFYSQGAAEALTQSSPTATDPSSYDMIGRSFYIGLRAKF
jgi:iron complex outermembrane receptor protein